MKLDHSIFFECYRSAFGSLKQSQVDGLESLLTAIEADTEISISQVFEQSVR